MNGMKTLEDHCQLINDVKGKWPFKKMWKKIMQTKKIPTKINAKTPATKPGKIKGIYVKYYISGGWLPKGKLRGRLVGFKNKNLLKLTNYVTDFCLPPTESEEPTTIVDNSLKVGTPSSPPLMLLFLMPWVWVRRGGLAVTAGVGVSVEQMPQSARKALNAALQLPLESLQVRLNFAASTEQWWLSAVLLLGLWKGFFQGWGFPGGLYTFSV